MNQLIQIIQIELMAVSVILVLILAFFIVRRRNKKVFKKWNFLLVGSICSVLMYLIIPGGLIMYMELKPYLESRQFDADEWKVDPGQRVKLIDSLIKSKQLDGKTRKEVIELLGEDEEEYRRKESMVYYLGRERGFTLGVDSEWLHIYFQEEVVSEYKIIYG